MKTYVSYSTLSEFARTQYLFHKFLNRRIYCKIVKGKYYVGAEGN